MCRIIWELKSLCSQTTYVHQVNISGFKWRMSSRSKKRLLFLDRVYMVTSPGRILVVYIRALRDRLYIHSKCSGSVSNFYISLLHSEIEAESCWQPGPDVHEGVSWVSVSHIARTHHYAEMVIHMHLSTMYHLSRNGLWGEPVGSDAWVQWLKHEFIHPTWLIPWGSIYDYLCPSHHDLFNPSVLKEQYGGLNRLKYEGSSMQTLLFKT